MLIFVKPELYRTFPANMDHFVRKLGRSRFYTEIRLGRVCLNFSHVRLTPVHPHVSYSIQVSFVVINSCCMLFTILLQHMTEL